MSPSSSACTHQKSKDVARQAVGVAAREKCGKATPGAQRADATLMSRDPGSPPRPAPHPSRTRGSKHSDVIRARLRLRLSPPSCRAPWTCSPLAPGQVYVPLSRRGGQGAQAAGGGGAVERPSRRAALGGLHRRERCGTPRKAKRQLGCGALTGGGGDSSPPFCWQWRVT